MLKLGSVFLPTSSHNSNKDCISIVAHRAQQEGVTASQNRRVEPEQETGLYTGLRAKAAI